MKALIIILVVLLLLVVSCGPGDISVQGRVSTHVEREWPGVLGSGTPYTQVLFDNGNHYNIWGRFEVTPGAYYEITLHSTGSKMWEIVSIKEIKK